METWKAFDQNIISHSAAHHLMAIDDLIGEFGYARVSDIARSLGITRGSVSISLQPLKRVGLVEQDENRHLRLSADGQALVDAIKTKRALMRRLFEELLGVDAEQANVDACKLEHLISNETARKLVNLFRFLDGGPEAGASFVKAFQAFDAACAHDVAECATCEVECLVDRVPVTPLGTSGVRKPSGS